MMDISLVTDSTADIPGDLIESYQIEVVPNLIMIDGVSHQDGGDISRQEFYDRLPWLDPPPTTATASSGTYYAIYERLIRQGARTILSIHAGRDAQRHSQRGQQRRPGFWRKSARVG